MNETIFRLDDAADILVQALQAVGLKLECGLVIPLAPDDFFRLETLANESFVVKLSDIKTEGHLRSLTIGGNRYETIIPSV